MRRRVAGSLTFRRVRELVEHCASLHRAMGETLVRRAKQSPGEKRRVLLETLGESELVLSESLLEAYRRASDEHPSRPREEAWLQSTPASLVEEAQRRTLNLEQLEAVELDHEARAASRAMTRFFEELRATAPTPDQRDLLGGLRCLEAQVDRRHSTTVDASLV